MAGAAACLLGLWALLLAGCGGGGLGPNALPAVKTRTIKFYADRQINQGQLLPVDVIYVNYLRQLRELTALGPTQWFASDRRDRWEAKQTVGLTGGREVTVRLDADLCSRSPYVVIFANFIQGTDPSLQQVILDHEAWREESILVHQQALEPTNPALKALY